MSWNEPPNQNSWQNDENRNKKNPQTPPELDELFRKVFDKLNQTMGGRSGRQRQMPNMPKGMGGLLSLGLGFIVVLYLLMGIYIVAPAERAVITQFGKYVETVGSGPHWIPRFIRAKQIVDVNQVMSSQHSGYMLTTDQNIVYLELAIQYRVDNPEAFLFNVKDPVGSLQQATDSAMRQVAGSETLERILTTGRTEIRQKITDNITAMLVKYNSGLALVDVAMQPAKVPEPVKAAFDDVIKALEDRDRMENQAKAYSTRMAQVARGQSARYIQEAEAYRTQVESQAQGDANRFNAVLAEYRKSPEVMRERLYLQTMQQVLTNSNKILVDSNMSNNLLYLPIDKMLQNTKNGLNASSSVNGNIDTTENSLPTQVLESVERNNARNRNTR